MSTITAVMEADADGTLHLPLPETLRGMKVRVVATLEAAPAEADASRLGALERLQSRMALDDDKVGAWRAALQDARR